MVKSTVGNYSAIQLENNNVPNTETVRTKQDDIDTASIHQ